MHFIIHPNTVIAQVQKDFSALFPFLKLEFFLGKKTTPAAAIQAAPGMTISAVQSQPASGRLGLRPGMTVKELEDTFRNDFFLDVQVFRKSGNTWLQTTVTDKWTLYQQNEHGRETCLDDNKKEHAADYDLSRDSDTF